MSPGSRARDLPVCPSCDGERGRVGGREVSPVERPDRLGRILTEYRWVLVGAAGVVAFCSAFSGTTTGSPACTRRPRPRARARLVRRGVRQLRAVRPRGGAGHRDADHPGDRPVAGAAGGRLGRADRAVLGVPGPAAADEDPDARPRRGLRAGPGRQGIPPPAQPREGGRHRGEPREPEHRTVPQPQDSRHRGRCAAGTDPAQRRGRARRPAVRGGPQRRGERRDRRGRAGTRRQQVRPDAALPGPYR